MLVSILWVHIFNPYKQKILTVVHKLNYMYIFLPIKISELIDLEITKESIPIDMIETMYDYLSSIFLVSISNLSKSETKFLS